MTCLLLSMLAWNATQCNDGSPARIYFAQSATPPAHTILYLEGGGFCFDGTSCALRWQQSPDLMSSKSYPSSMSAGGWVGARKDVDVFYFRYCTSDSFAGNATHTSLGWSFLGAQMVRQAFESGAINVRTQSVIFSGSSAGAEGLYPHSDWLATFLGPTRSVRVLLDSGYFLASAPYAQGNCQQLGTCTEQGAMQRGVPLWQAVVDASCAAVHTGGDLWKCMQGPWAAHFITRASLFVFQWRFDSVQLGHDGIYRLPTSGAPLAYAQASAKNLTAAVASLQNVAGFFLPSCYRHTVLEDAQWASVRVGGVSLLQALNGSLRVADQCMTPNCNPTCPK
jgi:hypothetical protein